MNSTSSNHRASGFSPTTDQKANKQGDIQNYQRFLVVNAAAIFSMAGIIALIGAATPWGIAQYHFDAAVPGLVAALVSVIIHALSDQISAQRGLSLLVCSGIFCSIMAASTISLIVAPGILAAKYLALAAGGATGALLFAFFFPFVCHESEKDGALFSISRMGLASFALSVLFIVFLPDHISLVSALFFAVSLFCGISLLSQGPESHSSKPVNPEKQTDRTMIDVQSSVMLAIVYFQVGIACGSVSTFAEAVAAMTGLLVGALILRIDQRNDRVVSENSLRPYSLSLAVIGFLFLCSDIFFARLLALFLLDFIFAIVFCLGLSALSEHYRICKLNPIRVISKANAIDLAALCVGLTFGITIAKEGLFQDPTHLLSLLLAGAFCLVSSICGKDRYPNESMLIMGVDPKKLEKSTLQQRCRFLADEYGLSPRQLEVLELLVIGRNARYIAEKLTVSQSTAQTHIRAIYTKLNVHSHQEMMDKVISTRLFNEE